jgi:translation initiation factor 1
VVLCQQRTGRKMITTLAGLPPAADFEKILSAMKTQFCCTGSIINDEKYGAVIQLTGDQRTNVEKWLRKQWGLSQDAIKISGVS